MLDWLGIPQAWDQVVEFFTISAFWLYLLYGIGIAAVAMFLGWAFPPLRSLAGAVVLAIGVGLFGYRRGEKDAEARQKAKEARERARQQRNQQPHEPWRWPWG